MERVLRRGVERARREEWSTEGFVRSENRRIPTGKRKKEGEESWWKRLVVGAVELMICLVEHSIRGFLLLSTIFNQNHYFSFLSFFLLLPPIVLFQLQCLICNTLLSSILLDYGIICLCLCTH